MAVLLVSRRPRLLRVDPVCPAQAAVRQWVYEPTLLNGEPVEVVGAIDVSFSLR